MSNGPQIPINANLNVTTSGNGLNPIISQLQQAVQLMQQFLDQTQRMNQANTGGSAGGGGPGPDMAQSRMPTWMHYTLGATAGMVGAMAGAAGGGAVLGGMQQGLQNEWQLADIGKRVRELSESQRDWNDHIYKTADAMRMTRQEATQMIGTLSQLYGTSTGNLPERMGAYASLARGYGMDPQQMAGMAAPFVQTGVVGKGGMNERDFAGLIGDAIAGAGMNGREGEVLRGLASITEQISHRLIAAPQISAISGELTQMGATGLRSMQGEQGAALLGGVDQAIQSPGGTPQEMFMWRVARKQNPSMDYFAFQKFKDRGISNPGVLPDMMNEAFRETGKLDDRYDYFLSSMLGGRLNPTQVQGLRQTFMTPQGFNQQAYSGLSSYVAQAGGDMSSLDLQKVNLLSQLKNGADPAGIQKEFLAQGGTIGKGQSLAQAIVGFKGQMQTPEDKEQAVRTQLTNDLEALGLNARDAATSLVRFNDALVNAAKQVPGGAVGGVAAGVGYGFLSGTLGGAGLYAMGRLGINALLKARAASAAAAKAAAGGAAGGGSPMGIALDASELPDMSALGGSPEEQQRIHDWRNMNPIERFKNSDIGRLFGLADDPKKAVKEGVKEGVKEAMTEQAQLNIATGLQTGNTSASLGPGGMTGGSDRGPGSGVSYGAAPTGPSGTGSALHGDTGNGPGGVMGALQAIAGKDARHGDGFDAPRAGYPRHGGIDIQAAEGTDIHALQGGKVYKTFTGQTEGNVIMIANYDDQGRVTGYQYYGHMQNPASLKPGDTVNAGDVIGNVGETGGGMGGQRNPALGPHIHFQEHDASGKTVDPDKTLVGYPGGGGSGSGNNGPGTGVGKTRYSADGINRILGKSGMAGMGAFLAQMANKYGVPAELALAMFSHESSFGSAGASVPNNNPGNLEYAPWEAPLGATRNGRWGHFPSMQAGIEAWFQLVSGTYHIGKGGSIDDMIMSYAPPSENDTKGYIQTVHKQMDTYKQQISARGGLTSVPYDGLNASLHKGEMVLDAQTADSIRRGAGKSIVGGGGGGLVGYVEVALIYPTGQQQTVLAPIYQGGTPQRRVGRRS